MKFSPNEYAKVFIKLINEFPKKEEVVIKLFTDLINKSLDIKNREKVIEMIEDYMLAQDKKSKILVTSARPLSSKSLEKLKQACKNGCVLKTKISPEMIAGVKLLINNELMIDLSLNKKLNSLFPQK